jgi:glutathione S-transferase
VPKQLFWSPGTAAMAPHACLEEAGADYELVRVRRDGWKVVDPPDYYDITPAGRIPAYRDGDLVLHESAAICMHIADTHPHAGLLPALATPERADAYRWLVYLTNTLQATYVMWYQTARTIPDESAHPAIKLHLGHELDGIFDWIDGRLGAGGPNLLGETFSAADIYLFMLTRWGRNLPRKAWTLAALGAHYRRLAERPSVAAMLDQQGIEAFPE